VVLLYWKQYVLKLLWFVGLLVLVFAALHVEASVKRHVDATFHVTAQFWTTACVPFISGLYFGLLFIRRKPSVNLPLLLCIFLPAFMLSFYPSIVVTIASMQSHNGSLTAPVRLWMMELVSNGLVPIVAGATLMVGLFGGRKGMKD
jgi:hypothetical protein